MKVWQWIYRLYSVRKNVVLKQSVHIGIGSILWAPNKLIVGKKVYIGKYCTIQCDGEIGSNVVIGNQVGLVGRWDHDHKVVGKSIYETPWIGSKEYAGEGLGKRIVIEDDVWIGFGAVILTGVKISKGAIVGAGSVVVNDVQPYHIVAGVPAHSVGMRFTKEEIKIHEKILYGMVITDVNSL